MLDNLTSTLFVFSCVYSSKDNQTIEAQDT